MLVQLKKKQQENIEEVKRQKEQEAKVKIDSLNLILEQEKKAAADSKLQVKKTEESALENQAKLQKELDEAHAARDLLFAQNKTHISDLAKEKEE